MSDDSAKGRLDISEVGDITRQLNDGHLSRHGLRERLTALGVGFGAAFMLGLDGRAGIAGCRNPRHDGGAEVDPSGGQRNHSKRRAIRPDSDRQRPAPAIELVQSLFPPLLYPLLSPLVIEAEPTAVALGILPSGREGSRRISAATLSFLAAIAAIASPTSPSAGTGRAMVRGALRPTFHSRRGIAAEASLFFGHGRPAGERARHSWHRPATT